MQSIRNRTRPTLTDAAAQNRLQRRVGLVLVSASLFSALLNLFALLFDHHLHLLQALAAPAFWVLLAIAVVSAPSIFFSHRLLRVEQVTLFLALGLVLVVINAPGSLGGVAFFVYGLVLALRFGFFERRTHLKFLGITLMLMAAAVGSTTIHHSVSLGYAVGIAGVGAGFLYLYWAAFADEIEEYRRQSEQLRQEAIANRVLVRFGQNIAGVIHNLKSRLMSIEGLNDLISDDVADNKGTADFVEMQRRGIGQLNETIDGLLFAVRSYQRARPEPVSLGRIVKSAVEMLRANRAVRSGVTITLNLCDRDEVYGSPQSIIQILDSLIQNAWESMANASERTIEIETHHDGAFIAAAIRDRGAGLPFCSPCDATDCLDCPHFRLGRSTKPDGSGVGVVHLRELLREMGGRLKYESTQSAGTKVWIWFPRSSAQD